MSSTVQVNAQNFEQEVLQSDLPVFVDFYADWCMPCKMLMPIIDDLAQEFSGKVKFVKVNTEIAPELSIKYGIKGIPNVKIFKDGQEVENIVGVRQPQDYANILQSL